MAHIPEQMLDIATALGLQKIPIRETIWETTAGYAYRKAARLTEPMRDFLAALHALTDETATPN